MVADAGVSASLAQTAHAPLAVMLAYLRPATLLALSFFTVVRADACPPAVFAQITLAVVGAFLPRWPRHACCTASPTVSDH